MGFCAASAAGFDFKTADFTRVETRCSFGIHTPKAKWPRSVEACIVAAQTGQVRHGLRGSFIRTLCRPFAEVRDEGRFVVADESSFFVRDLVTEMLR